MKLKQILDIFDKNMHPFKLNKFKMIIYSFMFITSLTTIIILKKIFGLDFMMSNKIYIIPTLMVITVLGSIYTTCLIFEKEKLSDKFVNIENKLEIVSNLEPPLFAEMLMVFFSKPDSRDGLVGDFNERFFKNLEKKPKKVSSN